MAKQFAGKSLGPVAMEIDKKDAFPEDLVEAMVEMGFLGLKVPEEYGGLGLDMRSYVVVMEEAKRCATAALFISSANSLSSAPIIRFGTEEQKQTYLSS